MSRRWSRMPIQLVLVSAVTAVMAADIQELAGLLEAPNGEDTLAAAPALQICDNGGEGAVSCETKWTVNFSGWGWPTGCGISCADGHYACCSNPTWYRNATCGCLPDPPRPAPWSPESPGL